ncbi:unnamed protein product [Rotaria magnacalcarata]|uniref:Prolyl endopeptidase n=2 Tax=Rotaria magnacalcarata TaxID=392030 RepID=A0A8S2WIM8_9BILA|nr:unnamed protein product [Rotaria magnacalcarata]
MKLAEPALNVLFEQFQERSHETIRSELTHCIGLVGYVKSRRTKTINYLICIDILTFTIEFGNPDIREEFKWAKLISPLYNIPTNPKTYPAILVTTTDHDDGVVPAHSFISIYISQIQYQLGEITNRRGRPLIVRIDVRVGYSVDKPTVK